MQYSIINGDCLDVMREMDACSIDSIVTDPPYGLKFMGKDWDHGLPGEAFWREALRVAKPGAHLLAFGGTRTFHRLTCAIEDAGWEIRDCVMYVYGSGFPKSLDVSKAINKAAGAEREVVGAYHVTRDMSGGSWADLHGKQNHAKMHDIAAPATPAAQQWSGWGTALKPAWEPVIVARKPLDGTVAANVLKWGVGGINVDACRVPTEDNYTINTWDDGSKPFGGGAGHPYTGRQEGKGRWPANLILSWNEDEYELRDDVKPDQLLELERWLDANATTRFMGGTMKIDEKTFKAMPPELKAIFQKLPNPGSVEVLELFPVSGNGSGKPTIAKRQRNKGWCNSSPGEGVDAIDNYGDSGSAARFFYCAKASKRERNAGMPDGMANNHCTVKPLALMRYLCRLVTPSGGTILDPFCGSGSTGVAALQEGFNFIGIEKEAEYAEIALARLANC
jgi:hypothetical protein